MSTNSKHYGEPPRQQTPPPTPPAPWYSFVRGCVRRTASSSTISSLLTLFPKFFSSFLHSTCPLSVSRRYLALEGVYLPIRAAFPNYPTLRTNPILLTLAARDLHPLWSGVPAELHEHDQVRVTSSLYNSPKRFSVWAVAVSLAVTRAILVSFFSSA